MVRIVESGEEVFIEVGQLELTEAVTGMRVLVAEDNRTNQRVVKLLLERMGCVVRIVGNGEEALIPVHEAEFAVILMACQMPIMDGLQGYQAVAE